MTTRVETILIEAGFGQAVVAGLNGTGDVTRARQVWAGLRETVGYKRSSAALLTSGASQQKLGKNKLPSYGLMLTPERGLMAASLRDVREAFGLTGAFNLCPMASKGCAAACLSRSGQSGMPAQQRAQAVRTAFILSHPAEAGLLIGAEIRNALKGTEAINLRLNTTSDIRWEMVAPGMVEALAEAGVLMYDYTAWSPAERTETSEYSLTYSAKEPAHTSDDYLTGILANGGNVAMPFTTAKGEALPKAWNGFEVIDGDKSDERRLDPRGVIVGLRAKGHEWKKDNSAGFIRASA
ncbi:hypothetical protein SEA_STEAMY_88 [Mycobacterium phage Steamy]|uniref:Gene product 88 domain-containing protein n=1 Tax=Mycobacterium phage Steamy TaxID=2250309 RepID=A0A345L0R0_9CAUD|nr:hypothetical protein KIV62_gp13 [Mycobacterium phage Steamy]AXH48862.1 hypothetical protein SEA_STEAMY_88 [Mycobacterium phage Steamy]